MFDNLRERADAKPFYEEEAQFQQAAGSASTPSVSKPPKYSYSSPGRILGMTPPQRFVIAVMLMAMVCMLGLLALFITGKIGI